MPEVAGKAKQSVGEALLLLHLKAEKMPTPESEFRFHLLRRWRFDFAWPDSKIACEVEGGTRNKGRHNRHEGFTNDCEKYNEAQKMGWRVYRFTTEMVKSGQAINFLKGVL